MWNEGVRNLSYAFFFFKYLAHWVAGKETETMTSKGKHTAFMTYHFYLFFSGTLLMIFWLRNSCPLPHLFWTLASQLAVTFLQILSTVFCCFFSLQYHL